MASELRSLLADGIDSVDKTKILATGPSYDWNMVAAKCSALEEADQTDGSVSQKKRKIVWPCYDDVKKIQPDAISSLLNVSTYVKQKK